MRVTPQRRRVLNAVAALAHGTPEEIAAHVGRDGGPPLSPSTVYRALDALEACGAVRHSHLDHRAPTYHVAEHAGHIHLVCRECGRVQEFPRERAEGLVGQVLVETGFEADVTHMAIHGRCASCRGHQ
jgi:Fur family ferric uptake transcriptional regulator